jgi:hypothetical protein
LAPSQRRRQRPPPRASSAVRVLSTVAAPPAGVVTVRAAKAALAVALSSTPSPRGSGAHPLAFALPQQRPRRPDPVVATASFRSLQPPPGNVVAASIALTIVAADLRPAIAGAYRRVVIADNLAVPSFPPPSAFSLRPKSRPGLRPFPRMASPLPSPSRSSSLHPPLLTSPRPTPRPRERRRAQRFHCCRHDARRHASRSSPVREPRNRYCLAVRVASHLPIAYLPRNPSRSSMP